MSKIQSRKYCRNCYYPMRGSNKYCSKCGQEYTTGRIKLRHLIQDFLSQVFWFDSKLYRTIPALLFKPGHLTLAYFKGKHEQYFSPLRMFFFLSIIHFGLLAYVINHNEDANFVDLGSEFSTDRESKLQMQTDFDSAALTLQEMFPSKEVDSAMDSMRLLLKLPSGNDSLSLSNMSPITTQDELKISHKDLYNYSTAELLEKYEIKGFWHRLVSRQTIKLFKSNDNYTRFLLKRLSWFSLLMIPIFALLLKVLYLRRNRYFVEHIVFAFHFHSFAFLVFSVLILLRNTSTFEFLTRFSVILILIYLFIAMLRYYGQSKRKTFVKFLGLNFGYMIGFIFALVIFAILSFILF